MKQIYLVKLILFIWILIFCFHMISATGFNQKKIVITIDDLPTLSHSILTMDEQISYFNRILKILKKHKIKALGFLVGKLIKPDNEHLIHSFIKAGHIVGNHTFNHWDLNKVNSSKYINDIKKNNYFINKLNMPKKYFRYPMLHRGNKLSKKKSVIEYLKKEKFIIAPVSIDNDESMYNIKYVRSKKSGDLSKAEEIGKHYIQHMIKQTKYYEKLAIEINGKSINHILLIHMNYINSYYLDILLNWYKKNGWEFITIDEALSDPFYLKKDRYLGKKGLSYIERVNKTEQD